ncbi:uncharacterized protein METZ01_LOCUS292916 [marine metagenome]|uniref:Uncharacterized protein n=1 Tax=marine metagenome TaxID=408172 RepID=A0A382LYB1_9ZZZZ
MLDTKNDLLTVIKGSSGEPLVGAVWRYPNSKAYRHRPTDEYKARVVSCAAIGQELIPR